MAGRVIATRIGPSSYTMVTQMVLRGRPATLAVLVEVWGAGEAGRELERRLATGLGTGFQHAHGSATARLRTALERADRWLRAQAAEAQGASERPALDGGPLAASDRPASDGGPRAASDGPASGGGPRAAGASVLLVVGEEVTLAQVGPALAFARAEDGTVLRMPAESPRLNAGVTSRLDSATARPLGLGPQLVVNWARWSMQPGDAAILASSRAAGYLDATVAAALIASGPDEVAEVLAHTFGGSEHALLHVVMPGRRSPQSDSDSEPPAGPGLPAMHDELSSPGARWPGPRSASDGRTQPYARPIQPWGARVAALPIRQWGARMAALPVRRWSSALASFARRILVALLPAREGDAPDAYRVERAQLAAAAAIALPVVVLLATWWWAVRQGAPFAR